MSESEPPDPLARREVDRGQSGRPGAAAPGGALGVGLRIGIELLAALLVGVALGWVADRFLGTRPWGLIVFFFLGSAAGIVNVFRAAERLGRRPEGRG